MSLGSKLARRVRGLAARGALSLGFEGRGLVALCFHQVAAGPDCLAGGSYDPFQPLAVGDLRQAVMALSRAGYSFVDSHGAAHGEAGARRAWLTFDDGYANNRLALPVLREFGARATIFVSSRMVETGRAFWWDVLHRQRRAQGVRYGEIAAEREALKSSPVAEIEARLERLFGEEAFRPAGDADRPLSVAELQELARDPLIEIGNHTHSHAILPLHGDREARAEIAACQERLERWTGRAPLAIAYPNGDADARIAAIARSCGLRIGAVGAALPAGPAELAPMLTPRSPSLRRGRIAPELALARRQAGRAAALGTF